MPKPFEVDSDYLNEHMPQMVQSVFDDLVSQFLVLPKGRNFVEYPRFQNAYEILKKRTRAFRRVDAASVWAACAEDSLCLLVLRTMLGLSPPEWAEIARTDKGIEIDQGAARALDQRCRARPDYISRLNADSVAYNRITALISVAVDYLSRGTPQGVLGTVHRLDKIDTSAGLASLLHVAAQHVPYVALLYERYLGRPFASHRDSISELVGDVMEAAIEERLSRARITFRKTARAERVPGFDQAPDFIVPDEINPDVVIEAKLTGDDGTARDKVTRIIHLTELNDRRERAGLSGFEVVACIDGRGFGVRRQDMRRLILATRGKVFTLTTLDAVIPFTRLAGYVPD